MDREIADGDAFHLASYIDSYSCNYNPVRGVDPILVSTLTPNPRLGEKSESTLILVGESIHEKEALSRSETMAEQKFVVPSFPKTPTQEQKDKALAECKLKDPKGDLDRFLSSISSNGYRLMLVRAREGRKDAEGNFVYKKGPDGRDMKVFDTITGYIWLPSIQGGTVDQFVAWFANRYFGEVTEETMLAAFTKFKKKAIDAELITLRSQYKSKKGQGQGRGGDIVF
jgi:hypothetical protein